VDYRLPVAWDKEIEALSEEELIALNVGRFDPKAGPLSIIGNASSAVPGAAGESVAYPEKGIPGIVMADGPAGLRLSREYVIDEKGNAHAVGQTMPESIAEFLPAPALAVMKLLAGGEPKGERHEQYATAIPIGTALAQSWDDELAESCGDMVGEEMERFGVQLWLAPALNLHRDIRCGRNFEYFSEDPLLSGKMAAAISRGVQARPGCGVTIKHYAANNQETNRYNNNSIVRERTLRELYLRGFGIAVREGRPCAVMTSYNLLNGEHTSERRDLIRDVLRLEFGFDGIVMTDWIMGTLDRSSVHPAPNAWKIAAATGDLTMPGRRKDCKDILKMLYTFKLTKRELMANATRVVRMARRLQKKG
jgi:beta-glucosidase